jgi:hypothetical protein
MSSVIAMSAQAGGYLQRMGTLAESSLERRQGSLVEMRMVRGGGMVLIERCGYELVCLMFSNELE